MEEESFKYYSTLRPVAPGTFPKHDVVDIVNFETRREVNGIKAWGYIEYSKPLSEAECIEYELVGER